jgi:hypothetical protein
MNLIDRKMRCMIIDWRMSQLLPVDRDTG